MTKDIITDGDRQHVANLQRLLAGKNGIHDAEFLVANRRLMSEADGYESLARAVGEMPIAQALVHINEIAHDRASV